MTIKEIDKLQGKSDLLDLLILEPDIKNVNAAKRLNVSAPTIAKWKKEIISKCDLITERYKKKAEESIEQKTPILRRILQRIDL